MKKWLVFGGGFLSGVVVTFLVLIAIAFAKQNSDGLLGATMFDKPGQAVEDRAFKVMQVIDDNAALVTARSNAEYDWYHGTLYVMVNSNGEFYYDDQKIKVPRGKVARQVGIYKYTAKSGDYKPVPVIRIMD